MKKLAIIIILFAVFSCIKERKMKLSGKLINGEKVCCHGVLTVHVAGTLSLY